MNRSYNFIVPHARQDRWKQRLNKLLDIFQHILVTLAFILFLSFLQTLINR